MKDLGVCREMTEQEIAAWNGGGWKLHAQAVTTTFDHLAAGGPSRLTAAGATAGESAIPEGMTASENREYQLLKGNGAAVGLTPAQAAEYLVLRSMTPEQAAELAEIEAQADETAERLAALISQRKLAAMFDRARQRSSRLGSEF